MRFIEIYVYYLLILDKYEKYNNMFINLLLRKFIKK